jgi:MFS family permease
MKMGLGTVDRLAPRRVLMVTCIVATVGMGDAMIYNVLPSNVSAFGVAVGLVGVLLSANRFIRLASNPLAAYLVQRYGASRPVLASMIVAMGTTVLLGLAKGFALLLLARVLWGVCFSILRLTGFLVVLEEGQDGRRGRLMGVFSGGMRIGSLVGVLLGGILFDVLGRSTSFLIIAAIGLLGIPAFLELIRRSSSGIVASTSIQGDAPQTREPPHPRSLGRRFRDFLAPPVPEMAASNRYKLLAANFTTFSFQLVMSGILISTLGFYLRERVGDEVTVAGLVLGIATLNGLLLASRWVSDVTAPYLGHLGDRFGHERIPVMAIPICMAALLLLGFNTPIWLTFVWLPLAFLAVTASLTSLSAVVGGMAPVHRRPQVMSRFATWQDMGHALGPLLAYAALGSVSLTVVYLVGACFLLIALASHSVCFLRQPSDQRTVKA